MASTHLEQHLSFAPTSRWVHTRAFRFARSLCQNLSIIPTLLAMTDPKAALNKEKIDQIVTEFCSDIERFSDDEITSVVRAFLKRIPINKLSNAEMEYLVERLEYITKQAKWELKRRSQLDSSNYN
jgi:hypothetical protein